MLEVIELNGVKTTTTQAASNHVYLVDVSGSMYGALPRMKEHLKNTISLLSKPDDTFSIIYFSGRGQCGVVCEGVEVKEVAQMTTLHNAVDRWLNVIGLTGFIEPLKLAKEVASRRTNGNPNNFVMLTDGYSNVDSSRVDIVEEATSLTDVFSSCSFIEFGWYCDRPLIAKMAEATSGVHLFSDGYTEYTEAFSDAIGGAVRVPKITVNVNKKAKHVMYVQDDQIIITEPTDGVIHVPENIERVHSIVPGDVLSKQLSEDHLYMILYYATKNNNSKLVWNCLERLGDIALVNQYNNAFSKQELSVFLDKTKECVLNKDSRYVHGKDCSYVPAKDAYTIVDLLNDLAAADDISLDSSNFVYERTGKKREQTDLSTKFVPSITSTQKITGVISHSSRANFSIQVVEEGNVILPENGFGIDRVKSKRTKNYTIIRDGILNVKTLPILVAKKWVNDTLDVESIPYQVLDETDDKMLVDIELSSVPVINRNMIEKVTLEGFKDLVTDIQLNAAKQKVAKHFKPVNRTEGLSDIYGEEAAKWLSSIGVRDYGYSPHVKTVKSEEDDFYVANELVYAVKGLSSLPSINAVEKKLKSAKKLTLGESLIHHFLADGEVWAGKTKEIIEEQRDLNRQMSEYVYCIIVGRAWFEGFEERNIETNVDILSNPVKMKIDLKETQINL